MGEVTRKGKRDKEEKGKEKRRDYVISREGKGNAKSFILENSNEGTQIEKNSSPFELRSKESHKTKRNSRGGDKIR